MQASPDGAVIPEFIEIELEIVGAAPASGIIDRLSQLAAVTEVSVVDNAE
jgi:putative Mg2+ transporter-C (MgtC) family protein